jgi:predicted HicB family RNase H-like nuclease
MLKYKGYTGRAEVDFEARILFGRVNIDNAVITFQAETIAEAVIEFKASVDDYLEMCQEEGRTPQPPSC